MTEPAGSRPPAPLERGLPGAGQRLFAAAWCMALLTVLVVAAWLEPSPAGHGTHEQLRLRSGIGLQACSWAMITGQPCPTCGMTTAFAHAANGDLVASFRAQPAGMLMALASATGVFICGHIAFFGSRLGAALSPALNGKTLAGALALLGLAWVYKIAVWPGL
ncbi:MAG: DUF2752 domain-containing protein [Planctomycetota bacterium]|nr:DUF2752 domain-containing protein [Planctomycetota bacterium]